MTYNVQFLYLRSQDDGFFLSFFLSSFFLANIDAFMSA
jgi:hypothetical protein